MSAGWKGLLLPSLSGTPGVLSVFYRLSQLWLAMAAKTDKTTGYYSHCETGL